MTLEELGIVLRAEREKRGMSLDDAATHLKISARILRALEEGDQTSLPHAVYVRGFIRSYGSYLGLDVDELQSATVELDDEQDSVQPASVYTPTEMESSRGGGGKILLTLFLLLCVAGAVFFWLNRDADLFSELSQTRLTTAQPAPPLQAREEAPKTDKKKDKGSRTAEANKPATVPVKPAEPAAPAQPAAPAAQAPAAPASASAPAAHITPPPAPPASNPAGPAGTGNAAPGVTGTHKIIITALAECWIHSNADDSDTRQFSLRKGDTFALTFAQQLTLKLGNAGGVRIRYNGEDLPVPGKDGQVRTLTFPPAAQ